MNTLELVDKLVKMRDLQSQDFDDTCIKMHVGETLSAVLGRAKDERRLTCGLYESGLILEMNPDLVMLCILPINTTDDISLDIHNTLIEAFCLENEISLLKVDSVEKLKKLLGDRSTNQTTKDDNDNTYTDTASMTDAADFNCVLIEYSADKCTEEEADILQFYKETCDVVPEPIIELII